MTENKEAAEQDNFRKWKCSKDQRMTQWDSGRAPLEGLCSDGVFSEMMPISWGLNEGVSHIEILGGSVPGGVGSKCKSEEHPWCVLGPM